MPCVARDSFGLAWGNARRCVASKAIFKFTATSTPSALYTSTSDMRTKSGLFSRARPGPTAAKARGFMALPGEVRNMIYEYYFQADCRCEFAAKGCNFTQPKPRVVKLSTGLIRPKNNMFKSHTGVEDEQPITIRISRPLGKYNIVQDLQTSWPSSLYALNLVCKQVYTETIPFLYRKTIFVFDAPKRINAFLSIVSKPRLADITKLQLHYSTYGSPEASQDRVWQDKHRSTWLNACKAASKKLTNLQELEIWVQLNDCAPRFSLRESWVAPLLQFRRLTSSPKYSEDAQTSQSSRGTLHIAKIHILTRWSKNPMAAFGGHRELAKACTDLHLLFGEAVSRAILGFREEESMAEFDAAWLGKYRMWQYHLQFAKTGW